MQWMPLIVLFDFSKGFSGIRDTQTLHQYKY
jgi:hypothetical protein